MLIAKLLCDLPDGFMVAENDFSAFKEDLIFGSQAVHNFIHRLTGAACESGDIAVGEFGFDENFLADGFAFVSRRVF